jgi:antibiotic biosynthesis monooxygenase (ABM) superfamily enzyme
MVIANTIKGHIMIKVIIERNIADDLEGNYKEAIRSTLKTVLEAPGYISSESLTDIKRISHKLIITNWTTLKDWEIWYSSVERKHAIGEIAAILEGTEKITITEVR